MKKRLTSLITLIVCLLSACFVFAACGGDPDTNGDGQKYSLSKTEVSLEVGEETTLTITATPSKEFAAEWSVAPAGIASVDNGKVTALAEGVATVTAKVDGKTLTCTVTVTEGSVMYIYTLNQTVLTLDRGEEYTLTVDCQPAKPGVEYVWESSATDVVTVANGKVTAVGAGDATISVKVGGEEVASCDVTVIDYTYTVTDELTIDYGTTDAKINVTVEPTKVTAYSFNVDTAGQSVISVDENGNITTIGVGDATVTVKDGVKTVGTCEVTVNSVAAVQSTLKLHAEATATLNVTILPEAGDHAITFAVTEGDDVVSVSDGGVVTAHKNGTAKIKTTIDGVESFCDVTVADAFVNSCTITELDKGSQDDAIDITEGVEYWEQYIAKGEVNHKLYADPNEDIIENIFPVTGASHYLSDYQAWLVWHDGATPSTCSCGKCNKDAQTTPDGGWTNNGTKAYFSHENGTGSDKRTDLLDVVHTFNIKVFSGVSTIKIYTGSFEATVKAEVKIGGETLATQTFEHGASKADILTVTVDVKDITTVTIDFVITEFPENGNANGFITFAAASVSGPVYKLNKTSTQLLNVGDIENIVVTKGSETVTEGVMYVSSKPEVVTVDASGKLTAVAYGDAVITVTVDGRVRKLAVKVGYYYEINTTSVSLLSGQTHQITLTSKPAGSTQAATYTSNGTNIATVSESGLITAVAEGETTVDVVIGIHTYSVKVTVAAKVAATVSNRSFRNEYINLMSANVIYWEYYLYNEVTSPTDKKGAADLIDADLSGKNGEGSNYGAFINFVGGTPKKDSYDDGAWHKYSWGADYDITIRLPKAGNYEIRVYTGAWENTANKVTLLEGGKSLASVTLDKVKGGRSELVTFGTIAADAASLSLQLHAEDVDEGAKPNCRLMAIAIVDTDISVAATTTVALSDQTEMTGLGESSANLSTVGDIDWIKYLVEQAPGGSGQGNVKHIRKGTSTHLIGDVAGINANTGWDYKAGITWNNGDGEVNAGKTSDDDSADSYAGPDGDFRTSPYHNNFVIADDILTLSINVTADVKTITLYVSAYQATYGLLVEDSHGNRLLAPTKIADSSSGSKAYAITLNINATAEDTLTVRLYKTGGANVGLAAVAVGGAAQAA